MLQMLWVRGLVLGVVVATAIAVWITLVVYLAKKE